MKNISRKDFIKLSLASTLSIPLIGFNSCKSGGDKPAHDVPEAASPKYVDDLGLQVFAVRQMLEENADDIFKVVAEIGIKNIELFDPATIAKYGPIIKNYGMRPLCCHCLPGYISGKWETARNNGMAPPENYSFDHILDDRNQGGIKYLGIAIMMPEERETLDDYKRFAEQLNQAGEKSKSLGIQLYYHNHSFEFQPHGDAIPMQEMLTIFDPELVKMELDVFWVTIAGNDPLEWMNKLGNQLLFLHLKDLKKATPIDFTVFEVAPEAFTEFGTGTIDFNSILTKARSMGIQYAFIDQDHTQLDKLESIRRNYQFIKDLQI